MSRVCQGCGRVYKPSSGKQRFCALGCPGRPPPRSDRSFAVVFTAKVCDLCSRSYVPTSSNQRYCSTRCRVIASRSLRRVLYGPGHKASRRAWAPRVAGGTVVCPRCGWLIAPGEPWDLGHVDGNPTAPPHPEHSACNRGEPSRKRRRRNAGG